MLASLDNPTTTRAREQRTKVTLWPLTVDGAGKGGRKAVHRCLVGPAEGQLVARARAARGGEGDGAGARVGVGGGRRVVQDEVAGALVEADDGAGGAAGLTELGNEDEEGAGVGRRSERVGTSCARGGGSSSGGGSSGAASAWALAGGGGWGLGTGPAAMKM